MLVPLFISPVITVGLEVTKFSINLYELVRRSMVHLNFRAPTIARMEFVVCTEARHTHAQSSMDLTKLKANSIADILLNGDENNAFESVSIYWTFSGISVLPFGKGVKSLGGKKPIGEDINYSSREGVLSVKQVLEDCIKVAGERASKRQKRSSSSTAEPVAVESFDIVVANSDSYEVLTDESNMAEWLEQKYWFINFAQTTYSTLNEMVLTHFTFDVNKRTSFSEMHHTLTNSPEQSERLGLLCRAEADRLRATNRNFDRFIDDVVNELNQWSIILPRQYAYNEATRRLLINPIARVASMLLGAQAVHIEAPQCFGKTTPAHFVGKGPLDYVLTGSSTGVVVQSALDPDPEDLEDSDSDEDGPGKSQQQVEELSHVVIEAKILNNPAAFNQLCGECHDHAFVSSVNQANITNKVALASTGMDETGVEKAINSGNGGRGASKRPPAASSTSSTDTPQRAHKCVTGILTTGQTWEVFTFTTKTLDPREKPQVSFKGTLRMRVLAYMSTYDEPAEKYVRKMDATKPAEKNVRMSGATKPERTEVENIVALLCLAGNNRLDDPEHLTPPSTKSAPASASAKESSAK